MVLLAGRCDASRRRVAFPYKETNKLATALIAPGIRKRICRRGEKARKNLYK
jgi:hypothetical protein